MERKEAEEIFDVTIAHLMDEGLSEYDAGIMMVKVSALMFLLTANGFLSKDLPTLLRTTANVMEIIDSKRRKS